MHDDLVTAAVFGDQTQAIAARLLLQEAGVAAFLMDEYVSSGLFTVGAAVGGIKLQVAQSRLQEALDILDKRMPTGDGALDWSNVDVGESEDGEPSGDHVEVEQSAPAGSSQAIVDPEFIPLTLREERASRLLRGAVIGVFLFPIIALAFWRLLQVLLSRERLRPEYRRQAQLAALLVLPATFLWSTFCCILPGLQLAPWRRF